MNEQLIKFIEFCLMDGVITDKEREVIFRKSEELGVDKDECEIILQGMIQQYKNNTTKSEPDQSEKSIKIKEEVSQTSSINKDTLIKTSDNINIDFTNFIEKHNELKSPGTGKVLWNKEKVIKKKTGWTNPSDVSKYIKENKEKVVFGFNDSFVVFENFIYSTSSSNKTDSRILNFDELDKIEVKKKGFMKTQGYYLNDIHFDNFFGFSDEIGISLFEEFKNYIDPTKKQEKNNSNNISIDKSEVFSNSQGIDMVEVIPNLQEFEKKLIVDKTGIDELFKTKLDENENKLISELDNEEFLKLFKNKSIEKKLLGYTERINTFDVRHDIKNGVLFRFKDSFYVFEYFFVEIVDTSMSEKYYLKKCSSIRFEEIKESELKTGVFKNGFYNKHGEKIGSYPGNNPDLIFKWIDFIETKKNDYTEKLKVFINLSFNNNLSELDSRGYFTENKYKIIDYKSLSVFIEKNQKKISSIKFELIKDLVKVERYLKSKFQNIETLYQRINKNILLNENEKELYGPTLESRFTLSKEIIEKNKIHLTTLIEDMKVYENMIILSFMMVDSLIKGHNKKYYEIYEFFDKLNIFNSNWENQVSDSLSKIEGNLQSIISEIKSLNNTIEQGFEQLTFSIDEFRDDIMTELKYN